MGIAHEISFAGGRRRSRDMFMDVFSIRRVCRCYGLGGFNVRGVVSEKKDRHKVAPRRGRRVAGPPAVGAESSSVLSHRSPWGRGADSRAAPAAREPWPPTRRSPRQLPQALTRPRHAAVSKTGPDRMRPRIAANWVALAADAPAGLIRGDDGRVADLLAQRRVGRRGVAGRAMQHLRQAARGDDQPEPGPEQMGDLRQRDAQVRVQLWAVRLDLDEWLLHAGGDESAGRVGNESAQRQRASLGAAHQTRGASARAGRIYRRGQRRCAAARWRPPPQTNSGD